MRPVGTRSEEEAEIETRPETATDANRSKVGEVRTLAKSAEVRAGPDVKVAG